MVYWVFLRKLTHFKANRLFLLLTLIVSILISFFPLQYDVIVDSSTELQFLDLSDDLNQEVIGGFEIEESNNSTIPLIPFIIYLGGIFFFLIRLIYQSIKPIHIILKNKPKGKASHVVLENDQFEFPFSFFKYIFINPTHHKQEELDDILAHEKVHIRERHWIDLIIIELLTVIFWFNPFIWFFEHSMKQNHEYLADEGVLSRGQTPVRYQALLVNQLMGMQVIGLSNSLNFALGPNRLKMMTKQKTSKKKLLRLIWGIPVLAILLVAFAKPNYKESIQLKEEVTKTPLSLPKEKKVVITGKVVTENGEALPGASVVIKGSTIGTSTNMEGEFKLEVPGKNPTTLVISFVGFESHLSTISYKKDYQWVFRMERAVIGIDTKSMFLEGEVPPPPPPTAPKSTSKEGETFVIVEEMPSYPGGYYQLGQYVKKMSKKLDQKFSTIGKKLEGKAIVGFTINTKGEVTNIHIKKKTTEAAAKALYKIVEGMENWKPGKQRGKAVSVDYAMDFEF